MNKKQLFLQEKEAITEPLTQVAEGELYAAADYLSLQNAEKHRRILLGISVAGTLLTLAFLLYDEVNVYGLIFACVVMILCLFLIRKLADRLDCHRKYLEYRVLAEALRVQYFLTLAGIKTKVSDILPWSIKKSIPWVNQVLAELHEAPAAEKQSVLDCWIRGQKEYHKTALKKAEKKSNRDSVVTKTVLIVTLLTYLFAVIFEITMFKNGNFSNPERIRVILKVLLGTMSAATLFTGSYYGKMSLPNIIDDHKRMIALYEKAEEGITKSGETEDLLLFLAREYLNETSAWYAYQSKNTSELIL